jgi:adenosylcobinamide amidohydrolase
MSTNVRRTANGLVIEFESPHDVLSTTFGMSRRVRKIMAGNYAQHFESGILYLHVDGDPSRFCVSEKSYGVTEVTAVAFADLDSGLERAGSDPQEGAGEVCIIVVADCDMPDSTLARAGITVNEAVTATVQDLDLSYDSLSASGSARQTIAIACNKDSGLFLRGSGNHCKLGELIGSASIDALKESASMNGTGPGHRMSVMARMSEYGYSGEELFKRSGCDDPSLFLVKEVTMDSDPDLLATVSAVLHVYDEVRWGFITEEEGLAVARGIIRGGMCEPAASDGILETLACTIAARIGGTDCFRRRFFLRF